MPKLTARDLNKVEGLLKDLGKAIKDNRVDSKLLDSINEEIARLQTLKMDNEATRKAFAGFESLATSFTVQAEDEVTDQNFANLNASFEGLKQSISGAKQSSLSRKDSVSIPFRPTPSRPSTPFQEIKRVFTAQKRSKETFRNALALKTAIDWEGVNTHLPSMKNYLLSMSGNKLKEVEGNRKDLQNELLQVAKYRSNPELMESVLDFLVVLEDPIDSANLTKQQEKIADAAGKFNLSIVREAERLAGVGNKTEAKKENPENVAVEIAEDSRAATKKKPKSTWAAFRELSVAQQTTTGVIAAATAVGVGYGAYELAMGNNWFAQGSEFFRSGLEGSLKELGYDVHVPHEVGDTMMSLYLVGAAIAIWLIISLITDPPVAKNTTQNTAEKTVDQHQNQQNEIRQIIL